VYLIKYSGLQYRYNYINIELNLQLFSLLKISKKKQE
jgi:hypothetical protein